MRAYFETIISYYDHNKNKTLKQSYLVEALSFTEAESNITSYLEDKEVKGFEVVSMRKRRYEELVYNLYDDDWVFYEAKVKVKYEGEKQISYMFLIAGASVSDATEKVISFVKDSEGESNVIQVKQKDLDDLVIVKDCKETGGVIIGFEEQKEIEKRIVLVENIDRELNNRE